MKLRFAGRWAAVAACVLLTAAVAQQAPTHADTDVGGAITQDTIWGPGSPTMPDTEYTVVADVTVVTGVTLTVEPGVVVRFNPDLSLFVEGTLRIEATEAERTTFTSKSATPAKGDWAAVHVLQGGVCAAEFCDFGYGGGGDNGTIYCTNGDLELRDCSVSMSASFGVYCFYEYYTSSPLFYRSTFTDNGAATGREDGQEGVECWYNREAHGSPVFVDCVGVGNGHEAFECRYLRWSSGSPLVLACVATGNMEDGIQCYYGSSIGSPTISDCTVKDNALEGIEVNYHVSIPGVPSSGSPVISGCAVEGNGGWGITVDYCDGSEGSPLIADCTVSDSGGVGIVCAIDLGATASPTIRGCQVEGTRGYGYGIYCKSSEDSALLGPVISQCEVSYCAKAGVRTLRASNVTITSVLSHDNEEEGIRLDSSSGETANVTSVQNAMSGVRVEQSSLVLRNAIVAENLGYGVEIYNSDPLPILYCDIWDNDLGAVAGPYWGEGNMEIDPAFADSDADDFCLTCVSPCIDAGDPDTPPVDGTRIDMGAFQFGGVTVAPDPQAYGGVALFGEPMGGYPGWVWFSIPFYPCGSAEPSDVLGFDCAGRVFCWDRYGKFSQVYQPPFLTWDLVPANSYLLWLEGPVDNPSYLGEDPQKPFEFRLGRMGWTWLGMPGNVFLTGDDFMSFVQVKYPSDETGQVRTAQEDYDATPGNWIAWSWAFFDTGTQSPKTFTPYAPFGNTDCCPWLGYRAWVNVGAALDEYDPDQITLIWPGC